MPYSLEVVITWILPEYGGRPAPPEVGRRHTIRFQRDQENWLKIAWEVTIANLDFDEASWRGNVILKFSDKATPNLNYMRPGELIELLDAYKVIGVGKIIKVHGV